MKCFFLTAIAMLMLSCGKSTIEQIKEISEATFASLDTVQTVQGYAQIRSEWRSQLNALEQDFLDVTNAADLEKIKAITGKVESAFRFKEVQLLNKFGLF